MFLFFCEMKIGYLTSITYEDTMQASSQTVPMRYNDYISKLEKKETLSTNELTNFKNLIKENDPKNLTMALTRLQKTASNLSSMQEQNPELKKQLSKVIKKMERAFLSIFQQNNCSVVDMNGAIFSINKQELQAWANESEFFKAQDNFTNSSTGNLNYINLPNTKDEISSFLSMATGREQLSFYNICKIFTVAEATQCPKIQDACVNFLRANESLLESCDKLFKKTMYEMISRSPIGLKEIQDDINFLKEKAINPTDWTSYQGSEDGKTRYVSKETYTKEAALDLAKKWGFSRMLGTMSNSNGVYRLRMIPEKQWREVFYFICRMDESIRKK